MRVLLFVAMLISPCLGDMRAGVPDFRVFDARARAGERLTVVFFGGSLTWGANASDPNRTGFRGLMADYFRTRYPDARFDFVDASLGGTGSDLAVFRLDRDVLSKHPDLVFLDFACNDGAEGLDLLPTCCYEHLLRAMISEGIPVVQMFFAFRDHAIKEKNSGERPARLGVCERLACAYGTPVGDVRKTDAWSRIMNGSVRCEDVWPFDGGHPDDVGYRMFAEAGVLGFEAGVEHGTCQIPQSPIFGIVRDAVRIAPARIDLPSGWRMDRTYRTSMWYDGLSSRWMDAVAVCRAGAGDMCVTSSGNFFGVLGEGDANGLQFCLCRDGREVGRFASSSGDGRLFFWRSSIMDAAKGESSVKHMFSVAPVGDQDADEKGELRIGALCMATVVPVAGRLGHADEECISRIDRGRGVSDVDKNNSREMNRTASPGVVDRLDSGDFTVLIYGNSIALHGPASKIGWTNNWGMAASSAETDFAHLVVRGLEGHKGKTARFRIRNLANAFERRFQECDVEREFAQDLALKPDYLVIAVGENVDRFPNADAEVAYRKRLSELGACFLKVNPNVRIVYRSPFWRNPKKDFLTRCAAEEVKAAYVDAGFVGEDSANRAIGLFAHSGVANHPGDLGMRRIADAILAGFGVTNAAREVKLSVIPYPETAPCCTHPEFHRIPLSKDYRVRINGRDTEVRVSRESRIPFNRSWPGYQRPLDQTELASYVSFEGEGSVSVEVVPTWNFRTALVRPKSCGIATRSRDGVISFVLPKPGFYVCEVDGSHKALHVFYEPLRDFPLRKEATICYGPGVHIVGNVDLKNNDRVYVDRDAIVFGCFTGRDVENVRICGNGVIDGRGTERVLRCCYAEAQRSCLRFDRSRNIVVDGPIVMDSPNWSVCFLDCEDVILSHVKVLGQWRYNTDGIDICNSRNVRIRNCFVRSFDDTISIKGLAFLSDKAVENITVERCVLWCGWGKTIEPGIETWAKSFRNVTFRECDLIHNAAWAVNISAGGSAVMENFLFEDLRVELDSDTLPMIGQESDAMVYDPDFRFAAPRLLKLDNRKYAVKLSDDSNMGSISNAVVHNLKVLTDGKVGKPQIQIRSHSDENGRVHEFKDILIEGVFIDGKAVDEEDLEVDTNVGFDYRRARDAW